MSGGKSRVNYMQAMTMDVLEDLTKNMTEYGMEHIVNKVMRQCTLMHAIQMICTNACNQYWQLVSTTFLPLSLSLFKSQPLFKLRDSVLFKYMSLDDTCQEALQHF